MALVALALGAIAVCVCFPVWATSIILTGLTTFVWAADRLSRVGALEPAAFGGATYLAGAILLLGSGFAVLMSIIEWLRATAAGPDGRPKRLPLLLRWSWFVLGAILLAANSVLIPSARAESAVPGLVGAFILATLGWMTLTAAYAFCELFRVLFRAGWRLARVSPYSAGLMTAGGMGCALLFLTLNGVAQTLGSSISKLPSRSTELSCTQAMECWRKAFAEASPRDTRQLWEPRPAALSGSMVGASSLLSAQGETEEGLSAGPFAQEPRSGAFERCLQTYEESYSLKERARRVAASIVGDADAQDVIRDTLIRVCLHPRAMENLEPFLMASIQNGAISWRRHPGNWPPACDIDELPVPACRLSPDDEYLRAEVRAAVSKALCGLSADDRDLLRLRYYEELSDRQIADRRQISYVAARKQLERARARLREEFLRNCGGEVPLGNQ